MPMYDVKCSGCGKSDEVFHQGPIAAKDHKVKCECGSRMLRQISVPRRDSWPEDGITLEHVERHPKHFPTKQSLKEYCKSKGYSSGALL